MYQDFSTDLTNFCFRCLRCLCVAVPSYLTPALDSCLEGIDGSGKNEGASEITTAGFSAAISALLGAVR